MRRYMEPQVFMSTSIYFYYLTNYSSNPGQRTKYQHINDLFLFYLSLTLRTAFCYTTAFCSNLWNELYKMYSMYILELLFSVISTLRWGDSLEHAMHIAYMDCALSRKHIGVIPARSNLSLSNFMLRPQKQCTTPLC